MSNPYTRRDFLALSALGLTAASARTTAAVAQPRADKGPTPASAEVEVWVTSNDKRLQRAPSVLWRPVSRSPAGEFIVLSPPKKYQEILGFGAAFTDAACYNFTQISPGAGKVVPSTLSPFGDGAQRLPYVYRFQRLFSDRL